MTTLDWQTVRQFSKAVKGSSCVICGSTFNNGFSKELGSHTLCEFHSHMTLPIIELIAKCKKTKTQITSEVYEQLRANSWDRDSMIPFMSDEVVLQCTDFTLKNCTRFKRPTTIYDEALQLYALELTLRCRKALNLPKLASVEAQDAFTDGQV